MRYLIVVLAYLTISCASDFTDDKKTAPKNEIKVGIQLHEQLVRYKHGSEKELLQKLQTSIMGLSVKDFKSTKGVYQIHIDTFGAVSNCKVMRSVTNEIDAKVVSICDTLEFYPAQYNGKAMKSKLTLPIQVDFK